MLALQVQGILLGYHKTDAEVDLSLQGKMYCMAIQLGSQGNDVRQNTKAYHRAYRGLMIRVRFWGTVSFPKP